MGPSKSRDEHVAGTNQKAPVCPDGEADVCVVSKLYLHNSSVGGGMFTKSLLLEVFMLSLLHTPTLIGCVLGTLCMICV